MVLLQHLLANRSSSSVRRRGLEVSAVESWPRLALLSPGLHIMYVQRACEARRLGLLLPRRLPGDWQQRRRQAAAQLCRQRLSGCGCKPRQPDASLCK